MLGCFDSRIINNTLNSGAIQFDGGTQNSLIGWNTVNDPTSGNGPGFNGINLAVFTRRNRVLGNGVFNVPANFVGINSVGSVAGDGNHLIGLNTITGVDTTTTVGIDNNNVVNNTHFSNWISNVNTGIRLLNGSTGHIADANMTAGVPIPYVVDATSSIRQPFVIGPFTIASLPSASAGLAGARAIITNGIASPTYQQAVSATGTTVQPVFCNGSSWIYD